MFFRPLILYVVVIFCALDLSSQSLKLYNIDSIDIIAKSIDNDVQRLEFLISSADNLINQNKYHSIILAKQALDLAEVLALNNYIGRSAKLLGYLYAQIDEYSLALDYNLLAIEVFKESNDLRSLAMVNNQIAAFYGENEQPELTIKYSLLALNYAKDAGDKEEYGRSNNNLGESYKELGDYSRALIYYNTAQSVSIEMESKFGNAVCMLNIGDVYYLTGDQSKALSYFKKSLALFQSLEMDYEIKIVYVKIAKLYSAKKQFIKSESWLKKASQDIEVINKIKFERELYSEFEDLYQKQIMYEQALYYAKKKNALDATIKKNQIQEKLSALSAKNDNVERENKIELLQKQLDLNSTWTYVSSVIFILLIIVLLIIYIELKQIKRKKEREVIFLKSLKTEEELKMLQAKINPHFLYNALNSIASLAECDSEKAKTMILDLADMFSYSINVSNSNFNKVIDSVGLVNKYLKIEQTRFGDRLEYECFIDEEAKSYLVPRFLIQPLIENAVKHGIDRVKKGKIKLRVTKRKNRLNISVLDNGPEFPNKLVEGYGSQNIKHKLELLYKGKYKIQYLNKPEKMVRITIINPFIEEPKKFIN